MIIRCCFLLESPFRGLARPTVFKLWHGVIFVDFSVLYLLDADISLLITLIPC